MEQLTVEQIETGFIDPIEVLINQAISQVPGDKVDLVVTKLKERIANLDSNQQLDPKKIVHAAITIGKTAAAITPNKKDDAAMAGLELAEGLFFGTGGGLFGQVIGLIKAAKEAKKAN